MSSNRPSSGKKSGKRKSKQASRGALPFVIGGLVGVGLVVGLSVWYFSGKGDSAPADQLVAVAPSAESVVAPTEIDQLPTPAQLVKFEHAVGGFSCEMPGTPVRQPQSEAPGYEFHMLLGHGESAYIVYYSSKKVELDDSSSIRSFLKKWVNIPTRGLVSDEVFSIDQGCWVLSAKMVLPGGITRHSRFYYHRSSIVEFSMGFKAAETPKEMERFFRSIRLTP